MSDEPKMIWEQVPARAADATHRIIPAIYVGLASLPGEPVGSSHGLYIALDRNGMPAPPYAGGNGRPRPPKRRTIDLRVGDEMLCGGRWHLITEISARGSNWLTDEQLAKLTSDDGYVYRLTDPAGAASSG